MRALRKVPLPEVRRRRVRRPRHAVTRTDVHVDGWPEALDGLRLAHLSDIHVQRLLHPHHLDRAVETVDHAAPDLVLLTGDYVCYHRGAIPRLARSLARLPGHAPRVAVLGNHDHWCDGPAIRAALESVGICVLQNEHTVVEVRGTRLLVVGVDDARTGRHDPVRAFAGVPDLPTIALTHDPRAADLLVHHHPALILAGHTHGGQIRLGRLTDRVAGRLGQRYLHGLFPLRGGSHLYVSRGLGASVPVRVRAQPEVPILTLRRSNSP
jgi:predicted MPP superfamily phosphohydrolase